MRPHGKTKLGFFPLPVPEAKRLKNWLTFPGVLGTRSLCWRWNDIHLLASWRNRPSLWH